MTSQEISQKRTHSGLRSGARSQNRSAQYELRYGFTHGGARHGAGRPKSSRRVSHLSRPGFRRATPVHVTLRVVDGIPSLRRKRVYRQMLECFAKAQKSFFQVVRHSVRGNHLHLVVEASSNKALSRGMQGLNIRLAKRLNGLFGRRGRLFSDRYHAHVLRTLREVQNAVRYLLDNGRKHRRQAGFVTGRRWRDEFCSNVHDAPPRTWFVENCGPSG
ncbi:MAG: transposase [Myxococcota bacterium]